MVVEDNRADLFLLREALTAAGVEDELHIVPDGESAISFIDQIDADSGSSCPVLVMLDLNLPKKSGREVLQHMRQSLRCRDLRVLIYTSSN